MSHWPCRVCEYTLVNLQQEGEQSTKIKNTVLLVGGGRDEEFEKLFAEDGI